MTEIKLCVICETKLELCGMCRLLNTCQHNFDFGCQEVFDFFIKNLLMTRVERGDRKMKVDNCVYCPKYESIHSIHCQGYMSYCNELKKKINIYKAFKECDFNNV